jgi:cation/acetate symporter
MAGALPTQLPDWTGGLEDAGLADFDDRDGDGRIGAAEMLISRDGVTLALPIMAGYPFVLAVLVATGGLSAALAACAGHALAAGTAVGEDLFRGLLYPSATPSKRLLTSRLATIAAVLVAAWYVSATDFDILPAVAWAMSLAASAFLPALALSIWWPRMNAPGAFAAIAAGFAAAAAHILLSETGGWFGVSNFVAAVFGVPAGLAAGVAASLVTASPSQRIAALGEEIRDPSGETMHDRAVRLAPAADAGAAEAGGEAAG